MRFAQFWMVPTSWRSLRRHQGHACRSHYQRRLATELGAEQVIFGV
jgi:hypothetical protein